MKHIQLLGILLIMVAQSFIAVQANGQRLSAKDGAIIRVSSFAAQGNLPELKKNLNDALDAGLTVNEIKEAMVHLYAYTGFPRSIRGLQTLMEVLKERTAKGITDAIGKEASPIPQDSSKYARGKRILGELTGMPQPAQVTGYGAFAPAIDTFLKEHLFADIFERDVLSYAQRELVTISVIAAIGDADPMLQAHLGISLHVGWSPEQLREFIGLIAPTIGIQKTKAADTVLTQVLQRRSQ